MTKCCKDCQETKDLSQFARRAHAYRPVCKSCHLLRNKKYWNKNKNENIFKKYQNTAFKKNIEFKLSKEQFFLFDKANCFYCNDSLDQIRIDRLDNSVGYIIENVVSCCTTCNFLKGTMNFEDFIFQINKIAKARKK